MTGPSDAGDARSHIVIVGAGIAGLSAALRLRSLDRNVLITVIEATARVGGKIAGETVAGCVVDGGADVCIGAKLRATTLFAELGLDERVVTVNPNGLPTLERRGRSLTPAPTRFTDELLTFPDGMREMVDIVCAALDDVAIVTWTRVEALSETEAGWIVDTSNVSYNADAVIVAAPAVAAARLLSEVAPVESARLADLKCPPTTTVTMAWHEADIPYPLDATGYLVIDPAENVTACTWTSVKIPSHAPVGTTLLRGYVRGAADGASAAVLDEISTTLGVRTRPIFARTYEWPAGIPAYTPEHSATVTALADMIESHPGLYLAGSAFHGIGIPDCIASGERAAEAAFTHLSNIPTTISK
ncbi:MAG: FAD-dependent oxidoreductase [Gemmatimonadota bacterium]|nr:FAD-dependent oxidoreductase [Gemmatimonadota bacterium]